MNKRHRAKVSSGTIRTGGSGRDAFTLVEMLVVMAIIAILMTMIMPGVNKARETTRLVLCRSNLRQQYLGLVAWVNDHEGYVPEAQDARYACHLRRLSAWVGLGQLYEKRYLPEPQIFHCEAHRDHRQNYRFQWRNSPYGPDNYPATPEQLSDIESAYAYRFTHEADYGHGLHSRMRSRTTLLIDSPIRTLEDRYVGGQYYGRSHREAYNLLHADGQVTTLYDPERNLLYHRGTDWVRVLPLADENR